ncbi:hypothetical protein [Cyclobacterium xiamenense]|uniref:hypothetical protein n=1 Tax=Cyclobacterium xiamenense TaxID=1297121 RepID=UPI0035D119E1
MQGISTIFIRLLAATCYKRLVYKGLGSKERVCSGIDRSGRKARPVGLHGVLLLEPAPKGDDLLE